MYILMLIFICIFSTYILGWSPGPQDVFRDHQDYEPFLGSGIPIINLHFHYYWEGGQLKLKVYIYSRC